jgi:hypothetical protein
MELSQYHNPQATKLGLTKNTRSPSYCVMASILSVLEAKGSRLTFIKAEVVLPVAGKNLIRPPWVSGSWLKN